MTLTDALKKYSYVGIRTLTRDEHYNVGDTCRNSYDWDTDEDCSTYDTDGPRQLSGTSCTNVCIEDYNLDARDEADLINDLYDTIYNYGNGQKVLIAGDSAAPGNDDAEIIIEDAIIIHIKED